MTENEGYTARQVGQSRDSQTHVCKRPGSTEKEVDLLGRFGARKLVIVYEPEGYCKCFGNSSFVRSYRTNVEVAG